MRSSFTFVAALAAASAPLAWAQTWSDCNPMEKSDCPNNKAFATTLESNFVTGGEASLTKDFKVTNGEIKYTSKGAEFTINKKGESPTIQSNAYLHFGRVDVTMRAAPGVGIVSSIVLQSDNLDEVDWEFLGGFEGKVQSNYFGKGNTTTYDRMIELPVGATQTTTHKYSVDWTKDAMSWLIDDKIVRTLKYGDANGGKNFPQTPVNVRLGIWAGGDPDSNSKGTVEWAAGVGRQTDYKGVPFTMSVESIKITNYSPACEYKFGDKSGSYQSIQSITTGCDIKNGSGSGSSASASGSATGTSASVSATSRPSVSGGIFAPSASSAGTCTVKTSTVTVTVTPGQPAPSSTLTTYNTPKGPTTSYTGIVTETSSWSIPTITPTRHSTVPVNSTATTSSPPVFTGKANRNTGMGLGAAVVGIVGALIL